MMMIFEERIWVLFKHKWQQTLTYWSVFFSFGLCIAFLGPTILDLRCQTQSTLQQITWVFFSQQFLLLIGSCLGGLLKRTLLFSLMALSLSTLLISLVFAFIPLCNNVVMLAVAMAIAGTAMGVIDTIANLRLVKLYQKDSAVFLQVLHFFIGIGALVSPLVADPFLADDICVKNGTENSSSNLHHLRSSLAGKGTVLHNVSHYNLHTQGTVTTNISYAFWIMALINLPVPVAVCVLMYRERMLPCFNYSPRLLEPDPRASKTPTESIPADTDQDHRDMFNCCNRSNLQGHPPSFFILHGLGGAVLFITDGIIGSYAGFVYTYAVSSPLSMHHKTAGCLPSVFWASITAGRLAAIYLSYRYTAVKLLSVSLGGVVIVECMLLMLHSSTVFLFLGTCLLGLCISTVFPCMLALTEDILDYKGCATTVLVTSASTGEMVLQVLVGSVINSQGSYSFPLSGMIAAFIGFSFFLLFLYCRHVYRNYHTEDHKSTREAVTQGSS
ncbi:major facilitator superfamily domain-containing protein 4A-like [Osmerus mordax]|uniref:major facilitator superfamily domain-containing protein 4A-like n=1 Tax=Osmerus mordax TaxID=8014 RepID=UPI00350EE1D1